MKVNMPDDLLLAGLLDNDDELILLSQVCSGSDVPSFEKGFDLNTYTEEQSKTSFRFYKDDIRNLQSPVNFCDCTAWFISDLVGN